MYCKNCTCENCQTSVTTDTRRCNECGTVHLLTYFNIRNKKGDRRLQCKDCIQKKNKKMYLDRKINQKKKESEKSI